MVSPRKVKVEQGSGFDIGGCCVNDPVVSPAVGVWLRSGVASDVVTESCAESPGELGKLSELDCARLCSGSTENIVSRMSYGSAHETGAETATRDRLRCLTTPGVASFHLLRNENHVRRVQRVACWRIMGFGPIYYGIRQK